MNLDIIGLGEVCIDLTEMVEKFPEPDEKVFCLSSQRSVGGVTSNFCVGIARLGAKMGFIGGVGDDLEGEQVRSSMVREGVDLSRLKVHRRGRTALNIVLVDKSGQKVIIQDPLLKDNLPEPDELDEGYIASANAFHTTAVRPDTALKAMQLAKKHGLMVTFDLEKHVSAYGLDVLKPLFQVTDLIMPNKLGAMSITNSEDPFSAAKALLKLGPRAVIMTMGSRGNIVATNEGIEEFPAFRTEVLDTTGAGDAFNSAFVHAVVVKGMDFSKSSLIANASAALKIKNVGAQSGLPTSHELADFLRGEGIAI
jgi:ribokinase